LQRSFSLTPSQLKPEFQKLLDKLKQYENDRLASRAFAYLDIVSWLESKLCNVPVGEIIRQKATAHKRNQLKEGKETMI
jgi:hypothetical protein